MVKIQTIEKLFSYILEYSYLALFPLFLLSKSRSKSLNIVIGFYGLTFFLLLHYFNDIGRSIGQIIQTIYTLLEFYFFTLIFFIIIQKKNIRKIVLIFTFIFTGFQFLYYFISEPQKIDSIPIGVETIFLFFFAFLYFQQFFKHNLAKNIYEYPSFWLVVGILLYLGSAFFFNILANEITKQQFVKYWHYTYIPEILKNLMFGMIVLGYPFKDPETEQINKPRDIPNLDMDMDMI